MVWVEENGRAKPFYLSNFSYLDNRVKTEDLLPQTVIIEPQGLKPRRRIIPTKRRSE